MEQDIGGQDRRSGLVGACVLSSNHPASSRPPPVPIPHPGEAATATFQDMSSTLHPAAGRAHVPVLVRAVGTPPSHGCRTFPPIPHSASAGAGPGQAPAPLGTIRPLSGIQCRRHEAPACRMGPFWWQVPPGAGGSSWPPASSRGGGLKPPRAGVGSWHTVGFGGSRVMAVPGPCTKHGRG